MREAQHSPPTSGFGFSSETARAHNFWEGSMSSISSGPHFPIIRPPVEDDGIPTTREAEDDGIPTTREAFSSVRLRRSPLTETANERTSVAPHLDHPTGRLEIFRGTLSEASSYQVLVDGNFGKVESENLVHQLKTAIAVLEARHAQDG
ncbi:hypothetical protein [Xylophilus sp. GOD-11R]|uniref:hypothetical protein n=1 Tax=Xylophilus sp. GOD-11R TaxID=3089814 RepID=UPI00298C3C8E|nr:hypothetical protein [Xylophilus sp. GOD-11R]WPB59234.1 hypothetical protein R9X41_11535 [Xylophilus sp. GOD-11R]